MTIYQQIVPGRFLWGMMESVNQVLSLKYMKTYSVTELGNMDRITRVTLKEKLDLTGAEISANRLPAGAEIPFAHSHKRNEEIYIFTSGKGLFLLDGTKLPV